MATHYGDIPCVRLNGIVHITVSGTKCLCGASYRYSHPDRMGNAGNIIWRDIEAVTCEKCRQKKEENI